MQSTTITLLAASCALMFGLTIANGQGGKDPPGVNPTHFLCYRVSEQKPVPPTSVKLLDQFGASGMKIGRALFLCNPVSKNGAELKDKTTHLVCYSIGAKNAGKKVSVTNQFGTQVLTVGGTVTLCVPSLKKL